MLANLSPAPAPADRATPRPRALAPRRIVLVLVLLDLGLIAAGVLAYPALLAQPGGLGYVLEPVVLLAVYGAIALAVPWRADPGRATALRVGTAVGLVGGALQIANLAVETFLDLPGLGILSSAPFLLGTFALWGVAGFRAARRVGAVPPGVLAAVWAAMVSILIVLAFGFALGLAAWPRLESLLVGDPDFLRSGWRDLRAFALANQLDSGFSHLLGGLIVGMVVGALGAAAAQLTRGD